jgi:hypothetical protein
MALAGLGLVAYQFAFTVYGLLESISFDVVWSIGAAILATLWLAQIKWMYQYYKKRRREKKIGIAPPHKDYPRKQVIAVLSPPQAVLDAQAKTDGAMEALEHSVHEWSTRGDTPGSLAGSVIGLEVIDEYLEGDM